MAYRGRRNRTGETTPVPYEEMQRRVYKCMQRHGYIARASEAGQAIWPNNGMHAQGLGLAAVKQLKRMERDGLLAVVVKRFGGRCELVWQWCGAKPAGL